MGESGFIRNYLRVISEEELNHIQETGKIPTSFETWGIHHSGSVIFLLEIENTPTSAIMNLIDERLEGKDSIYIIEIRLSNESLKNIEVDRSQEHWDYSKVHVGEIVIEDLLTFKIFKVMQEDQGDTVPNEYQ